MTEAAVLPVPAKGLRSHALGMVSSTVIGMSSTAPAYSIAATLGFVVLAGTGFKAAAFILFAFIPVLFVALAFRELNAAEPDCGTNFTWATRAFGSRAGWLTGWVVTVAQLLVMSSQSALTGKYTLLLFGLSDLADNRAVTTAIGCGWLLLLCWLCYRGIEVSARTQWILLGIELTVLVIFSIVALTRVYEGSAGPQASVPQWSWLWPSDVGFGTAVSAVLLAVFIYWGWESSLSVNEESADPRHAPGRAAVLSTVLLVLNYLLVTVAALAFAGVGEEGIGLGNEANAEDVLAGLGGAVFGTSGFGKMMGVLLIISVLTSGAATSQATIMPAARTTLSMASHGALPKVFARVHPKYQTPSVSTWAFGLVSLGLYVLLAALSKNILSDSVDAVGLTIAIEYTMTALACAWVFRRTLLTSVRNFFLRGLLPFLGGVFFLAVLVFAVIEYAKPDAGETTLFGIGGVAVIGVVSILVGIPLMFAVQRACRDFFAGRRLRRGSVARHGEVIESA
ncbi:amino acid/polyamine/organocation transporter (APC superfamily) [Amycolatopsis sulphurea]|uniref:Amino acid/polyamine/organocation transporter (APC superfamily) n=1 Tax=Amycolatopsis sulphurea TaxID=76022 RepID=A0A2A9FE13_9PSEU|nr:APC family permease [Amycolatopsis sulphurea]PFG48655.1 amino acid/polyamine/organocation transporter (APC superfamily) [Amycolatopsis sulphurea]